jgi:hydrogenase maturation protease
VIDGRAELQRAGAESVVIAGVDVRAGSRLLLRPRAGGDILMRGLDGRRAIVDAVMTDLDDRVQLTVSLEDDPARTLGKGRGLGHRFFFSPDEVEPLGEAAAPAPPRVLVAGIGNVFLGDDGFGVAVAERLAERALPDGVDVVDFGIRGMDLAYALADGYDAALMIDAAPRGQSPGTLEVVEPELDPDLAVGFDAHGLDPVAVLHFARRFGDLPRRTLVIGCEPQHLGDADGPDIDAELSAPVQAAVDSAVELVCSLIDDLRREEEVTS